MLKFILAPLINHLSESNMRFTIMRNYLVIQVKTGNYLPIFFTGTFNNVLTHH